MTVRDGMAQSFCLSRTRKQLKGVLWALLFFFLSVALGVTFWMTLGEHQSGWKVEDYVKLVVSGGGAAVMLGLGVYSGFTGIRDAFFPEKSSLACSIRSQLPYPNEAPPVGALFAMVDNDLRDNGQWFGNMGIGQEWVLGELATRIDRIRGIFTVDEIHQHRTQNGVNTNRTLQLVLIDDRWQKNTTDFKSPDDLRAAAEWLALRVPEARRGRNSQYMDFWGMDESARQEFEREFRQRQNLRASEQLQKETVDGVQDMILKAGGEVTSRVTMSLVEERLKQFLTERKGTLSLTATKPVSMGGRFFQTLEAEVRGEIISLTLKPVESTEGVGIGLVKAVDRRQAVEFLERWFYRQAFDLTDWTAGKVRVSDSGAGASAISRPKGLLMLVLASGASETHRTFTKEDIQVAAEGLADGTYQIVGLTLPQSYRWIQVMTGNASDGRCTVEASRPGEDLKYYYVSKMTPREAARWLTGFADGLYLPGGEGWKKCIKK